MKRKERFLIFTATYFWFLVGLFFTSSYFFIIIPIIGLLYMIGGGKICLKPE